MEETEVVTCFLRNRGAVLLTRRSDAVGSYRGRWGTVAGHVAASADPAGGTAGPDRDPETAAREEIAEETGLADDVTLVRSGDPFPVEDEPLGVRWIVHPFLFDVASRDATTNEETSEAEWVPPTELLRRETVPELWRSYDAVRPTAETVADDREHGSTSLSIRALEVLRDEAGQAVGRDDADWSTVAAVARDLRDARPTMAAVRNRIDRAMDRASDDHSPAAVEVAAHEAIADALAADDLAAEHAADLIEGDRVLTLSRSGTVGAALDRAGPDTVLVAESRPGSEGVGVAERLADRVTDVTLVPDAALAQTVADGDCDAILVGADTVLPDGRVVNKVGTRVAGLVAAREDVTFYVVAAADKIHPTPAAASDQGDAPTVDAAGFLESVDPSDVYGGDADVSVSAPLFDVTPADLVDGVVTEDGILTGADLAAVADEHAARAAWDE